jgi:hypothetical protein
MTGRKTEGPKAPILVKIIGGDEPGDGATERAWSAVMDGCSEALATPGLPSTERADLMEILTSAAEISGRLHELRPSLASSDSP